MSSKKGKWKDSAQKARRLSQTSSSNLTRKESLIEEETSAKELEEYLETLKKKSGIRSLWRGNSFDRVVRDEEDKTPDISISSMEEEEFGRFSGIMPTICKVTSSYLHPSYSIEIVVRKGCTVFQCCRCSLKHLYSKSSQILKKSAKKQKQLQQFLIATLQLLSELLSNM